MFFSGGFKDPKKAVVSDSVTGVRWKICQVTMRRQTPQCLLTYSQHHEYWKNYTDEYWYACACFMATISASVMNQWLLLQKRNTKYEDIYTHLWGELQAMIWFCYASTSPLCSQWLWFYQPFMPWVAMILPVLHALSGYDSTSPSSTLWL